MTKILLAAAMASSLHNYTPVPGVQQVQQQMPWCGGYGQIACGPTWTPAPIPAPQQCHMVCTRGFGGQMTCNTICN
jgi:hypothetical protein